MHSSQQDATPFKVHGKLYKNLNISRIEMNFPCNKKTIKLYLLQKSSKFRIHGMSFHKVLENIFENNCCNMYFHDLRGEMYI